jgi:hypothetical protein
MNRLNFRDVQDRFSHIDAEFVVSTCDVAAGQCSYTVKFYPWWEHPSYLQAVERGLPWGFTDTQIAAKQVTVWSVQPRKCRLSFLDPGADVIDWLFTEQHPLLWAYEDQGNLYCNDSVDGHRLTACVREHCPDCPDHWLWALYERAQRFKAPFSLGRLPRSLFKLCEQVLMDMGVRTFAPHPPSNTKTPILFLIDGEDYIIAEDFELDVPTWEHSLDWWDPKVAEGPS